MASVFPIPDIILWAKISQYLGRFYLTQNNLFRGGDVDPNYPQLIRMERRALEFMYNFNPNEPNIDAVANYVYGLTKYIAQAKVIAGQGGSGGIVIPGTSTAATIVAINGLEFEMGVTASPKVVNGVNVILPTAGSNSITIPLENIMAGSLEVVKDGVTIPTEASTLSIYCTISLSSTQAVITLQGDTFENNQFWQIFGLQYVAN